MNPVVPVRTWLTPFGLSLVVACLPGAAQSADATVYGMVKSQQFVQSGPGVPVAQPTGGFGFNCAVLARSPGAVLSATVDPPGGTPERVLALTANDSALRYEEIFDSAAALEAAYPNGGLTSRYLMTFETLNDGVQSADLNFTILGVPIGVPPVLRVTTFNAIQAVDTTADVEIRWTNSGAQALDQVQVVIVDGLSNVVFQTPAPFATSALTGNSNHVVVPAYTLPAGANLFGHLAIARPGLPNTTAYPGAVGVAAMVRDTAFPLLTRPEPTAPRIEIVSANPARLRITGETNRVFRLQASVNLTNWHDLLTTDTATGTINYTDPNSTELPGRAYRAALGQAR